MLELLSSSASRPPIPRWCPVRAWLFFTFLPNLTCLVSPSCAGARARPSTLHDPHTDAVVGSLVCCHVTECVLFLESSHPPSPPCSHHLRVRPVAIASLKASPLWKKEFRRNNSLCSLTDDQGLGWATASTTLLSLKSLCGGGVPSSHPSLGLSVFFLFTGTGLARTGTNTSTPPLVVCFLSFFTPPASLCVTNLPCAVFSSFVPLATRVLTCVLRVSESFVFCCRVSLSE